MEDKEGGWARAFARALTVAGLCSILCARTTAAQDLDELLGDLLDDAVPIQPSQDAAGAETDAEGLLDDTGLDALLGGESGGWTEDAAGEGTATTLASDPLQSWKGFLELRPRVYLRDRDEGRNDEQFLFEGELELDFRLADDVSAYFRPRIFFDAFDSELERYEPYEAYLTLDGGAWDLRFGQFVENWGIVDTFNPIDVVNRRDFGTDALDTDRLGELGVRYRRFFRGNDTLGEPTVSLYALPLFRRTPFPPEDQRFGFAFDEDDGFEPDGIEQALFAARLQATLATSFMDADVQALVARGPERVPTLFTSGAGGTQLPAYFGVFTAGAGFRAVPNEEVAGRFLSTLTLKAEVVHKTPYAFDDSPVDSPDDYLTGVFGADRSFYGIFDELDQLTLTVEYARETGADDPASLFRPFRDDLILRGLWEANDFARQSLELRALLDLDVEERVYELLYERQLRSIHPDLQLEIELRVFDRADPGESFFSLFPDNSSIAIGLRWDF